MQEPARRDRSKPTSGTQPAVARAQRLKAIGLMCLAVTCFSALDATAKYLVSVVQLPTTQVVWVRFLGQFLGIILLLGIVAVPRLLTSNRMGHQIARSFLMLGSTILNFIALRELRLDQTTTIMFLAPLMVALLAGPFLGEWVGWRRMIAILVGFCGILIVVRPGFAAFQPGLVFAFGGMLCYTCFILLTRYLSSHDSPEVTIFYSLLAGTYFAAPLALVDWVWPDEPYVYLLLAALGFWGGLGHYLFILAHRYAPASTIAPFLYVQLLSIVVLGYVIFQDLPDKWSMIGASVVVASGIYLIYRESQLRSGK